MSVAELDIEAELTGKERKLLPSEIISTQTDPRGLITFANGVFTKVTGFSREEVLGRPHNLIRHPDVPRALYYVLWSTIKDGHQFFGVTKNRCKNGDHYWTLGMFQPNFEGDEITGFRSTRKGLKDEGLKAEFDELYRAVRRVELEKPRPRQVEAGYKALKKQLKKHGYADYEAFARRALAN